MPDNEWSTSGSFNEHAEKESNFDTKRGKNVFSHFFILASHHGKRMPEKQGIPYLFNEQSLVFRCLSQARCLPARTSQCLAWSAQTANGCLFTWVLRFVNGL